MKAPFGRVARWASRSATSAVVGSIRVYQWAISPLIGPACRFEPSCSRYMVGAIEKYGLVVGVWRGFRRLLKCGPWHPGGYDPP